MKLSTCRGYAICHEFANREFWITKLPRTNVLVTSWRPPLVQWHERLFFFQILPLKLCFFSFENITSLPPSPKNLRKSVPKGSILGRVTTWKRVICQSRFDWMGSIYFKLARGGGLPPQMQEVELRPSRRCCWRSSLPHVVMWSATTHDLGRTGM
jgi:hypothetical protein